MSKQDLMDVYRQAWQAYYTSEHVERVIRRAKQWRFNMNKVKWMMRSFYAAEKVEGVHPMDSGLFRLKYRCDRRAGMPREHPVRFYGRYGWEIVFKPVRYVWLYLQFHGAYRRVMQGKRSGVEDVAMQPVQAEELDTLNLYQAAPSAKIVAEKLNNKTAKAPFIVPIP